MKKQKIIFLFCVMLSVITVFSSCGYEINITKKDKNSSGGVGRDPLFAISTESDGTEEYNESDIPIYSSPTEDKASLQPSDNGSENTAVDGSYTDSGMSAVEAVNMYKNAMNGVKSGLPGYVKNEKQNVYDVKAFGKEDAQLANNIISLVASEVIKGQGDNEDGPIRILKGDSTAVKNTFPLFGRETGCELTDMSVITSAVCYRNDNSYKLVITTSDQLNPAKYDSEYGKIMAPMDRDSIYNSIKEYFVVVDNDQYRFDVNYTQNEIVCLLDRATLRMTGLTMHTVMDININLNMNLIIYTTSAFKVSGKIEDTLEYSSFKW